MTKKSVEKLMAAGYIFFRARDYVRKDGKANYVIVQSSRETGFGSWKNFECFETKAARKRRLEELDGIDNYIQ